MKPIEAVARAMCAGKEKTAWEDVPDDRWEQRQCSDKKGNYRSVNENSKEDYLEEARIAILALADNISDEAVKACQQARREAYESVEDIDISRKNFLVAERAGIAAAIRSLAQD